VAIKGEWERDLKLLSTRDDAPRERQLTRDDWIVAALEVLISEGVDALQITRLSRDLGVTRGSFYWHLESREELLDAVLAEWRARNTGIMVDVLKNAKSLEEGILDLFSVWVDHSKFSPQLDQAVRDWARRDEKIRELVTTEDDDRVRTISRFFKKHGYDQPEAFIRARVIYFTQLSYYALGVDEPNKTRMSYLSAYFRSFTGRDLDPAIAKRYRDRFRALGEKK